MGRSFCIGLLSLFLLTACNQKESSQAAGDANAPHATITMRDGTKLAGTVTSSTPLEVSMNLDGGGTRTVLTKDIKAMEYDQPAAAGSSAVAANTPPNGAPLPAAEPPAAPRPRPDKAAIQTKTFEIPAGTEVSVQNDESIDSSKAAEGQTYAAEVTMSVRDANGAVVIPRGANAQLVIKSASSGGKIRGSSDLVLDLRSVSVDGQEYLLNSTDLEKKGNSGIGANKRTGEFVGGGAALGAVIGAIAGGGKGSAIGAASGAGAGALTQILTKGNSIKIPAETVMTFKLDQSVRIVERK
jgi:hypothetical protein